MAQALLLQVSRPRTPVWLHGPRSCPVGQLACRLVAIILLRPIF